MAAGPVINMKLVFFVMMIKSIRAGEYADPPAEGPMMAAIWGITPEHLAFLKKSRAKVIFPNPPEVSRLQNRTDR